MFDPSTHKVFASRDVIFHEHANEGNKDNNNERWHILPEIEDNKAKAKVEDSEQQKLQEECAIFHNCYPCCLHLPVHGKLHLYSQILCE